MSEAVRQKKELDGKLDRKQVEIFKLQTDLANAEQQKERLDYANRDGTNTELQSLRDDKERLTRELETTTRRRRESTTEVALKHQLKVAQEKLWCSVCVSNGNEEEKRVCLVSCGHAFCRGCIDERITSRNRKCPLCLTTFDKKDVKDTPHQRISFFG